MPAGYTTPHAKAESQFIDSFIRSFARLLAGPSPLPEIRKKDFQFKQSKPVVICVFNKDSMKEYISLQKILRDAEISTEIYPGESKSAVALPDTCEGFEEFPRNVIDTIVIVVVANNEHDNKW